MVGPLPQCPDHGYVLPITLKSTQVLVRVGSQARGQGWQWQFLFLGGTAWCEDIGWDRGHVHLLLDKLGN